MWLRKEKSMNVPVVEVTASTPLKAHFDDLGMRKEESGVYNSSVVDDEKEFAGPPKPSFYQRVKSAFHLSREPLPNIYSDIYYGKADWRSIGNLLLAVYATVLSGVSLAIAVWQPRYGKWISPNGPIIPSTADLLFSIIAKSIEIASVGLYMTFLGQCLTKRCLRSRGIGLPDIAVREWLLQPGFVIWSLENLKYASTTLLGFNSFLTAIAVFFFTVASNSLVSPHITLGNWESTQFYGEARQNFGNSVIIKEECWAPINARLDNQDVGESCMNVLASGLALQDLNNYMKEWAGRAKDNKNTTDSDRPVATSSIFTDTRTSGRWVEKSTPNISANFDTYGRVVNNVTLSMPHPVVYYSVRKEFPKAKKGSGLGEYTMKASVLSPTSNTMCVNMNRSEAAPLVYLEWPGPHITPGVARRGWDKDLYGNHTNYKSNITATHVGSIFKWGSKYDRQPPIFPQWPIDFNSVININIPHGDSIYILIKSPNTTDYTICQMQGYLSPDCSTKHVQNVGATSLQSDCDDKDLSFAASIAPSTFHSRPDKDFRDVLGAWAIAVGLNSGLLSSNTSLGHVLSQLVIPTPAPSNTSTQTQPQTQKLRLNPTLPSLSEALAVLSASMLLKASINTTSFTNTSFPFPLPVPRTSLSLPYPVRVQTQQFRSGPPAPWQGILYPRMRTVWFIF
ncbi:hypothetical protein HYALB_00006074 [Hymenoscyphus albidus]|uniref:Uncharacterized protein n=1 Tax=Hymenoscyphus albidus TaxID=595503 RepID=A0A9N9M4P7_9HELO|nr:hypothetical protein HYALB_00006074 [Hymenoscyphus albidus]